MEMDTDTAIMGMDTRKVLLFSDKRQTTDQELIPLRTKIPGRS